MRSIYSSVWRSEIQFRSDFCYSLANITYTKTEHLHNETAQTVHQKAPYKADAFWDAARRFGHSIYEQVRKKTLAHTPLTLTPFVSHCLQSQNIVYENTSV